MNSIIYTIRERTDGFYVLYQLVPGGRLYFTKEDYRTLHQASQDFKAKFGKSSTHLNNAQFLEAIKQQGD